MIHFYVHADSNRRRRCQFGLCAKPAATMQIIGQFASVTASSKSVSTLRSLSKSQKCLSTSWASMRPSSLTLTIPVGAMGLPFEIRENVGPVIASPIRHERDVERLQVFDAQEKLPHVLETIRLLSNELSVPLIGFMGAPFTLASYMVEGGPSQTICKPNR